MSPLRLMVGLGNPGAKYERTRHNVGFMAVDALAGRWGLAWREKSQWHGWVAEGQGIVLLKPNTYMNHSGQAVQAVCRWFKFTPREILVIYDDLDLPFGRLRLRKQGSAGGHNGMKSIIAHLGTQEFPRLRIGIGRPVVGESAHYVLEPFSPEQQALLPRLLNEVVRVVELALREGLDQAMNIGNALVIT
ncbi:MAG: aminoacyl-tRNA hydrolase [Gloeomargarita sp. SKYG116]|nr:aminoacyl-tRNA hydrolase [Gloeomargarita sp. SKYG116]MCS7292569.1 aminoacyl-tRNA hydrolase [Gloeomargarita sp. SKYB120]MDW8178130.1 aminoacyl-tRNA hydrolase [Gloeomargarita sp. SKYBB_i_bin120]MDW8400725.1 aminoacyl-tRNA hydrolase [Gloeomargarita sp. SKYGB_i_bin116]